MYLPASHEIVGVKCLREVYVGLSSIIVNMVTSILYRGFRCRDGGRHTLAHDDECPRHLSPSHHVL